MSSKVILDQYTVLLSAVYDLIKAHESNNSTKLDSEFKKIKRIAMDGINKVEDLQTRAKSTPINSDILARNREGLANLKNIAIMIDEELANSK